MIETAATPTGLVLPPSQIIQIKVASTLEVPLGSLACSLLDELLQANTFRNPKYDQAKRLGRWTGKIDEYIKTYRVEGDLLHLPRGFYSDLTEKLRNRSLEYRVDDYTICPRIDVQIEPQGELYPYQEKALRTLLKRYAGVLVAPPGSGKTNVLLTAISELKTTALILVHTKDLLYQTAQRCREWLGLDPGIIGDGKFDLRPITVGMIQTLSRRKLRKEGVADYFGAVMVDECHHSPAATWSKILEQMPARYKYGFTATAWRKDGLQFLMWKLIGKKSAEISKEVVEEAGKIIRPQVEMITTDYIYDSEDSNNWGRMLHDLVRNKERNQLIAREVRRRLKPNTRALILTDRIIHVELLAQLLADLSPVVLIGELSKREREDRMDRVRSGARLTIATTFLMGEGIDVPGWDLLFLASPISGGPRTLQAVGRIARPSVGKVKALVIDFVDVRVSMLLWAWEKRKMLYAA